MLLHVGVRVTEGPSPVVLVMVVDVCVLCCVGYCVVASTAVYFEEEKLKICIVRMGWRKKRPWLVRNGNAGQYACLNT